MSNPQDWKVNLPGQPLLFPDQRPGETQDEYYRRTGKGFFIPGPAPGSVGKIGDVEVELNPVPQKGQGPAVAIPTPKIAPDGEQVELLEKGEPLASDDPSVYYNGTEALDKLVEVFGLQQAILWCRMTAMKYSLRMGKKAGNSVEQEAGKISWYLAAAERLTRNA